MIQRQHNQQCSTPVFAWLCRYQIHKTYHGMYRMRYRWAMQGSAAQDLNSTRAIQSHMRTAKQRNRNT